MTFPLETIATRRAAQYVRMSTDMQKYSTDNQQTVIALYASTHNIEIVRTYADEGKSGLKLQGRPALRQLIDDVCDGSPSFDTILVYDVSRWGRFQDADESAHYEFICRQAGIAIQYCAEEFENDGSLAATIIKTMKRAMAGEYSRELSAKVFLGKCNLTRRGFRHGGLAGYGLRRMAVDEHGASKIGLEIGQEKYLHTDRVILVPGPPEEIQVVRRIFDQFTFGNATLSSIARDLNARGIKNGSGRLWLSTGVRRLLSSEKYIGNNVFNQTSIKLKGKCVRNPPEQWIRKDGAFAAIVDKETFSLAQQRLSTVAFGYTDFQLLDKLTALWCRYGELSTKVLEGTPGCPSPNTFITHFQSMIGALKRVGYPTLNPRPVYTTWRKSISEAVTAQVEACGGNAKNIGIRRQSRLLVNGELLITVAVAHPHNTLGGQPRWTLKYTPKYTADLIVLARLDETCRNVMDYLLIPGAVMRKPQKLLALSNHLWIDSYRSDSLLPLASLLQREDLNFAARKSRTHSAPHQTPTKTVSMPTAPILQQVRYEDRNITAILLVRAFWRQAKRAISFVEKCDSIAARQLKLQNTLRSLLLDKSFCKLLFDEGLDNLPSILAKRLA